MLTPNVARGLALRIHTKFLQPQLPCGHTNCSTGSITSAHAEATDSIEKYVESITCPLSACEQVRGSHEETCVGSLSGSAYAGVSLRGCFVSKIRHLVTATRGSARLCANDGSDDPGKKNRKSPGNR